MKYPEKVDFRKVLGPNLQIYYCYLVSQMADFANGGVFSGPKIRHFRELTVIRELKVKIHKDQKRKDKALKVKVCQIVQDQGHLTHNLIQDQIQDLIHKLIKIIQIHQQFRMFNKIYQRTSRRWIFC